MAKKTLEGFGCPAKSGPGMMAGMKKIGEMLSTKGVRAVGGTAGGCTGGSKAAGGDVKMKPIGGGKGIGMGGKGPVIKLPSTPGMKTSNVAGFGKSGLAKKGITTQPS